MPAERGGAFSRLKSPAHTPKTHDLERSSLLNERAETPRAADAAAQQRFTKRIGNTTYRVRVHFSETSRETMNDKIMRLIKNEVAGKAG
jgi:hypothetical protein